MTGNEINHLLVSGADWWYQSTNPGGGFRFRFPLFVKAGTSIGAKAQTDIGTAGTVRVSVHAYCQPSRPDAVRAGSFVRTFGVNTGTTSGTSVTQGTASEGSWTEIGTAADRLWWLECGLGVVNSAMSDAVSQSDVSVGDASNKRTVMRDLFLVTNSAEATIRNGHAGIHCDIASGDKIYGRSQASAAMTGFQMGAYGVVCG